MSDIQQVQYWQGEPLPLLKNGRVWGFRIWPGGRMEVYPCRPNELLSVGDAMAILKEKSGYAIVELEDAEFIATYVTAKNIKEATQDNP